MTSFVLTCATPAFAQQPTDPPICTDRPTKANATCTVPAGKFQLESSVAGWTRIEGRGARTDVWAIGASVVKFGLTDRSDLQVGFTPYIHAETKVDGSKSTASGFGDMTVRYKHRLTGDGAKVQVAAISFVKVPTAKDGLGNGKVEGGLAVPISLPLSSMTLTFGPELDLIADADNDGRHVALVNLVNLAGPIAPNLTLVGELWTATNFDPADTVTLASADVALAYAVNKDLQLDLGANLGLTSSTPDLELYAGISIRF